MSLLLRAVRFAAEKHRDQRRRDPGATPYINHPIEVAEHLVRVGGVQDEAILAAALLHDTIEDTDATEDEVRAAFGDEVCSLVMECTDDKSLPKQERKHLQVVHAPHKSPAAAQIKLADKCCNLRSILEAAPVGWPVRRQLEYFEWAAQVVEGLQAGNPDLEAEVQAVLQAGRKKLRARMEAEGAP